jgi:hypothetical protein
VTDPSAEVTSPTNEPAASGNQGKGNNNGNGKAKGNVKKK